MTKEEAKNLKIGDMIVVTDGIYEGHLGDVVDLETEERIIVYFDSLRGWETLNIKNVEKCFQGGDTITVQLNDKEIFAKVCSARDTRITIDTGSSFCTIKARQCKEYVQLMHAYPYCINKK